MKKNNKIKKFFIGIGSFFTGLFSKVYAVNESNSLSSNILFIEDKYGVMEPQVEPIIGKILLSILLFIIGLIIVFNKKITKKVKAIGITILVILGVLGFVLINYFANNY